MPRRMMEKSEIQQETFVIKDTHTLTHTHTYSARHNLLHISVWLWRCHLAADSWLGDCSPEIDVGCSAAAAAGAIFYSMVLWQMRSFLNIETRRIDQEWPKIPNRAYAL